MLRTLKFIAITSTLLAVNLAFADRGDDWLAGKTPPSTVVTYSGAPFEFKYGHPSPPASVLVPIAQANLKRIATATNGKLNIKEYGSGSLFGARDGFKGVRTGVGEWGVCYPTYEGRGMPLSRVWELPFVTPSNPMAATRIAQELANKYFVPEFKKQGVSWGNYVAFQPSDVLSKKPIRKIEDLQGMKIGAQGFSPEVAKALGVALVNLPYPELYTALQQGIIDANAQVGTDMNVVDSQNSVLDEISLRLKTTLSDVQDLDYTEAITKMNKDQLALEAAQSSFAKISKLTLFSYIN